ncbi:unnamed protein product, partial [Meganyctiphanes norvegica]
SIPSNNSNIWKEGAYAIIPRQNVDINYQKDIKIEDDFFDETDIFLKIEEQSKVKRSKFVCTRCNVMFINQSELEQHYEFHPTHVSPVSLISQNYVSSRLRMHTNKRMKAVTSVNKSIIKKIRKKPSTEESNLPLNVDSCISNGGNNLISYNGIFECFQCKFISRKMSEIANHIAVHNKKENSITQHENDNEKHEIQVKKYKCNDCKFSTYDVEEFKHHLQTHRNRIPHQCAECEASFISLQLIMCSTVQTTKRQNNKDKSTSLSHNIPHLNSVDKEIKVPKGNDNKYVKSPIVVLERIKDV